MAAYASTTASLVYESVTQAHATWLMHKKWHTNPLQSPSDLAQHRAGLAYISQVPLPCGYNVYIGDLGCYEAQ